MKLIEKISIIVESLSPENPVEKCQKTVGEVAYELEREGIQCNVIEGTFNGYLIGSSGKSYHWFIKVEQDNIIVDPTVLQFTSQYSNTKTLIPDEKQPEKKVFTVEDELYKAYESDHSHS